VNIRKAIEKKAKSEFRSSKIRVAHENDVWYVYTCMGRGKYLTYANEKNEICFKLV